MKLNREWHLKNKMPKNATFKQRAKWHLAHQKHCKCRPIPPQLLAQIEAERKTVLKNKKRS